MEQRCTDEWTDQVLDTRPSSSLASDWRRYFNSELLSDVCLLVGDMRTLPEPFWEPSRSLPGTF